MNRATTAITQSLKMQPVLTQIVKLQQADVLQLTDADFHALIREVEKNPLFYRLYHRDKLIHYQKFPRTDIHPSFYELKDNTAADPGSLDVESLVAERAEVVRIIKRLGAENFKKFFLFPEGGTKTEEIAAACALSAAEVKAINALVDDFAVMSEFYHPPATGQPGLAFTKVAAVARCPEGFIINYFSPAYARGRYVIDYGGFEQRLADARYSSAEVKEARTLFKKLELINSRKNSINGILQSLVNKQALFFESGKKIALLPFSQKELAAETGLAPSSVSRAIKGKSLVTPRGEEIPLTLLTPTPKLFKKELIRQLLLAEPGLSSDENARTRLREKTGINISRRSLAHLRGELKLPARGKYGKGRPLR
jgi:DNA-directed RNA polymerase specialized sigma54-like protein